ncbi:MAG TPA: sigma-70 family RNA polymerase sigma factor [Terriglobales bacterium]|nr:sigma-70 family RNA polymerase sigma factor [Terriglobales bacterium]
MSRLEREEVERLYRTHAKVLVVFASSVVGDRSKAQDVVQQVFLKLIDRPIEHPENWAAYLYSAVRNTARNEVRSNQRLLELDEAQPWFAVEHATADFLSERRLRRALWALPEEQREVAVMHIWGELTFATIARVLGINENTAASRYRYALAQLREAMQAKKV